MKTTLRRSFPIALVVLEALGVFSAHATQPQHKTQRTSFDSSVPAADPVYDSAGNPAVAGDTPLYANASGLCGHLFPLVAPDDHHITLAEWQRAKGSALIKCGPISDTFEHPKSAIVRSNSFRRISMACEAPAWPPADTP